MNIDAPHRMTSECQRRFVTLVFVSTLPDSISDIDILGTKRYAQVTGTPASYSILGQEPGYLDGKFFVVFSVTTATGGTGKYRMGPEESDVIGRNSSYRQGVVRLGPVIKEVVGKKVVVRLGPVRNC